MKPITHVKMRFLPLLAVSLGLLAMLTVACGEKKEDQATSAVEADTGDAQFVNIRCPMMGTVIDPAKVTPALTRMHEGAKVGFCCPMCVPKWDDLTDDQKDAKLVEAGETGETGD